MLFFTTTAAPLLLCLLQLVAAGPGPINFSAGKRWTEWNDEEAVVLATDEVNVTAAEGQTAALPCRVIHLNDKRVSWIRKRDLAVLAMDRVTVTSDQRFSVIHPEETGDWILEIRTSSLQDSGAYDCQVNTYPKKSTRVNLQVLSKEDSGVYLQMPASDSRVPRRYQSEKTYIQGSSETKYPVTSKASQASVPKAITLDIIGRGWAEVHVGKALGLTCEAHGDNLAEVHSSSRASENPLIEWTLDEVPVTLLFDKEKVEVHESWRGDLVVSQLTLYDLTIDDSGIFGCHAPHAAAQTIPVTVLRAGSTAYLESINKYARRKGFESQFPTDSWPVKKPPQNDAAETPPQPVADQHLVPSKAPACTSNKAMVISGAVMLFIMIVNSAIGIAMYCKTH